MPYIINDHRKIDSSTVKERISTAYLNITVMLCPVVPFLGEYIVILKVDIMIKLAEKVFIST